MLNATFFVTFKHCDSIFLLECKSFCFWKRVIAKIECEKDLMRRLVQRTIADFDLPKSIFGLEAESASVNDVRMISGTPQLLSVSSKVMVSNWIKNQRKRLHWFSTVISHLGLKTILKRFSTQQHIHWKILRLHSSMIYHCVQLIFALTSMSTIWRDKLT